MQYHQALFPFRSRWTTIENHQIHYVDEGSGQVLLFSHAAIGSSFMYRYFIKRLGKHFRCVALDFPGFGLSENQPGKEYGVVSQSRILESFIRQLGLSEIWGMGHDTGGPTLCKVAADHPEWFQGLILTDTLPYPPADYPKINRMLAIVGSKVVREINVATNFILKLTLNKGIVTRSLTGEEKEQYFMMYRSTHRRRRMTEILASLRHSIDLFSTISHAIAHQLNRKPTLLIYGEIDPVAKIGVADRLMGELHNAELKYIAGEGHFPHEGQPEQMCIMIERWISRHLAKTVA